MEGQTNPIICKGEPAIAIPTNIPPNIPPQYWGTETGFILAIAILIRSVALLIQVLTPLMLRQKSGSSKK
ncbi:hypothetical protein [Microseira wollei]|uniref:Uncharacterized protein n=1 Tax=Microseira wollei NIES-4236 TaxID=2530354 RepID=A0AAV3X631_9CYAN|nr:hypothetical protein [Microseira wollei]GET37748.1 hypothetical protein MiSe_25020 [Microseira wollei NIES-4236]HAZ49336.1 hypothetical protein [Cyanobacteria bacterium UBA11371]